MASAEIINGLKVGYTDELSKIEEQSQTIKGKVTLMDQLSADVAAEVKAAEENGF